MSWVAVRTLRQLPKVVGETDAGEPIVEVRSIRLVLRDGAGHFSRVTTCSKCGREVPGAAVLAPSDLDRAAQPVICKDCVRTASAPLRRAEHRTPEPVPPGTSSMHGPPAGDPRLAALERRIAQGVGRTTASAGEAEPAQAVEARLSSSIEHLAERVDEQRTEMATDVEARLAAIHAAIEDQTARAGSELAALQATVDELVGAKPAADQYASGERVRAIEAALIEVQERIEVHAARTQALHSLAEQVTSAGHRLDGIDTGLSQLRADSAAEAKGVEALQERLRQLDARLEHTRFEATRALDQVTERVDRQAERAARTAAAGDPPLETLEQRLEEAVSRLAEIDRVVRQGLDEAGEAVAAVENDAAGRLQKIETTDAERAAQLAELVELQTTLDIGLGELRSQIERVREMASQAGNVDSGVAGTVEIPRLRVEPERGRRGGRKSAEAVADLSASVQAVIDGHRQLRAEVLTLQDQAETAVRAAARATAQASDLRPLRHDVRALRDEVVAQNEAVAALTKAVESLRRAVGDAPESPRSTKATKATKAARVTKAPKAAPAKATKSTKSP